MRFKSLSQCMEQAIQQLVVESLPQHVYSIYIIICRFPLSKENTETGLLLGVTPLQWSWMKGLPFLCPYWCPGHGVTTVDDCCSPHIPVYRLPNVTATSINQWEWIHSTVLSVCIYYSWINKNLPHQVCYASPWLWCWTDVSVSLGLIMLS